MLYFCPRGYRLISVHVPPVWTHFEFMTSFDQFLDALNVQKAHLFGVALGGFLVQLYCQYKPQRVESMILANTFLDTRHFVEHGISLTFINYMPEFYLKRIMLDSFPRYSSDSDIVAAVDFMVEMLETLKQPELASRLCLNCSFNVVKDIRLPGTKITVIETLDEIGLPRHLVEQVARRYSQGGARVAHLRQGGDFPYLSKADDINMYIQVHMRTHSSIRERPLMDVMTVDNPAQKAAVTDARRREQLQRQLEVERRREEQLLREGEVDSGLYPVSMIVQYPPSKGAERRILDMSTPPLLLPSVSVHTHSVVHTLPSAQEETTAHLVAPLPFGESLSAVLIAPTSSISSSSQTMDEPLASVVNHHLLGPL
mmetsp:Transcript_24818/g.40860  ORF Transcript_24818/g.40860 Transcript_24818/m.40860 type:complete len:370 (-) Transcript_24818:240-1349(-)